MSDRTARLSIPFLMPDQAMKHLTINEALEQMDALVQPVVVASAATDPGGFEEGDCVLVGAGGTGVFAGRANSLAAFQSGAWNFHAPQPGWQVHALDEQKSLRFDGQAWVATADPVRLERLGINADADAVNRLAVSAPAVLLNHEGAGHQLKINKANPGDTASLLFQTGFSGRAEIGTMGSDALQVKVSADGNSWFAAVHVQPSTGNVGIGTSAPLETLHLKTDAPFCSLRLERQATSTRLRHFNGGTDGNDAIFDVDPLPGSAAASAEIRYFRNMATTGPSGVRILRGNGTASANAYLSANADSYLNASVGNLGVGTAAPTAKLHVAGAVRVGTSTVAALPAPAGVGAGAILFVSNAAGGATLAFSDGAAWRRVHDNQPVG